MRKSLAFALTWAALVTVPAEAATLWVAPCSASGDGTVSNPFCTIQEGVDAAAPGDIVRVLPGTYHECVFAGGAPDSLVPVSLVADDFVVAGRRDTTIVDGTGVCSDPSLYLSTVALLGGSAMEGFTVRGGGYSGVAGLGGVAITSNVIEGNQSSYGGGIYVNASHYYGGEGDLVVTGNIVQDNEVSINGGGIYVYGYVEPGASRRVVVDGNTVRRNVAGNYGGGVASMSVTPYLGHVEVAITRNVVEDNAATGFSGYTYGYGGGIWASTYGAGTETLRVEDNDVRRNQSGGGGGGLSAWLRATYAGSHRVTVDGNRVAQNAAYSYGGGLDLYVKAIELPVAYAPTFEARGNDVSSNQALVGAGGMLDVLVDSTVDAVASGAGIVFERNRVADNGADGNAAPQYGAGLEVAVEAGGPAVATADLRFNTIVRNLSDLYAGGVDVAVNTAFDGSGTYEGLASLTIEDSIVADNEGFGIGKAPIISGSTENWTYSIRYNDVVGNGQDYEPIIGTPPPEDHNISADPLLGSLDAPDACSATIDAADPAADYSAELQPNGSRANQGHLGGTADATPSLPDVNGDHLVDGVDVLRIASAFASTAGGWRYYAAADLNRDSIVDGEDLAYVAALFGKDCR